MIFEISKQEERRAKALYESYAKLIADIEAKIDELAPETPLPDDPKDFDKWLKSGSKEWRDAREKRLELIRTQSESMYEYYQKLYDEHFKKIGDDPEAIVKSAYEEIDTYITRTYRRYEKTRITGKNEDGEPISAFSAADVRATETGFLLDADETVKRLLSVVSRHLQKLKSDKKRTKLINDYLVKAVAESSYTSSEAGELFGKVAVALPLETTEKKEEPTLAVRPTDYVTTVDRVTKKLFDNALVKPIDSAPDALYDVRLDDKGKVFARVAIDYKDLLSKGNIVELPELNERDYNVHDAIITLLLAGNRVMSYDMIYRAMTGKVSGKIRVPDEARKIIDEALDKFRGTFKLEYEYIGEDGIRVIRSFDEPLVTFQRLKDREKINGKIINGGIRLADDTKLDPPLLKWARLNGNELDTRDITLLDVPRLNNGDESFTIKMCLYRRLISMRNTFERVKKSKYELADNKRTIRYDYVYAAIGLEDPDANKRRLVKDKIDRCMKYWAAKGFISGYEHKRDKSSGNNFYAVMVSFMPKK